MDLYRQNRQPSAYLSNLIDSDSSNAQARVKLQHGTTTLAFRYKGGCIVCVDSRATAGSYIGAFSLLSRSIARSYQVRRTRCLDSESLRMLRSSIRPLTWDDSERDCEEGEKASMLLDTQSERLS